jgi:hypothetical protein
MDFQVINLKLLAQPVNWGIVWTVLLIAAFAYTTIHDGLVNRSADQSIIPD